MLLDDAFDSLDLDCDVSADADFVETAGGGALKNQYDRYHAIRKKVTYAIGSGAGGGGFVGSFLNSISFPLAGVVYFVGAPSITAPCGRWVPVTGGG